MRPFLYRSTYIMLSTIGVQLKKYEVGLPAQSIVRSGYLYITIDPGHSRRPEHVLGSISANRYYNMMDQIMSKKLQDA
jgi:hypothetical protein